MPENNPYSARKRRGLACMDAPAVTLDKKLWSKLPSDLLERTLAFLPLPILFRFRCVCKRWNSLPSCPSFTEFCKRLPIQRCLA
ncbi:hypothetical protein O6H91_12G067000 [Diphasiastrum complanatum]|uniref:Uncharacterized protein n=1 Tax=Diphasiastrum complanatum TaxID=34168 RepID=A0ACC2C2V2_DIPCM|nr:hypothetical protein O6H91_12G067000 [Diphasiastrum complanatum]